MTTVQTMLTPAPPASSRLAGTLLGTAFAIAACLATVGCVKQRGVLSPPDVLVAPYDTARGNVLWAVVPLTNESGVSFADTLAVSDALVSKIQETRGLSCLPLNRTIAVMRALDPRPVNSPQQARSLANALGVDGLVVGTITAYDPYNPPKLGVSLALFTREAASEAETVDPMALQIQYSEFARKISSQFHERPASVVSLHLDGGNHEVLFDLRRYQTGRHDSDSALGWRGALASMDLYTRFAAHLAVGRLLEQERLRLTPATSPPAQDSRQAAR